MTILDQTDAQQAEQRGDLVCLALTTRKWGVARKLASSRANVEADPRMIRLSKVLLDCPEYKAIASIDAAACNWVATRTIPGPFKAGIYLTSADNVTALRDGLVRFAEQRAEAVEEFLAVYPMAKEQAARQLRELYDPANYPAAEQLRGRFTFDWQFFTFAVPDSVNIGERAKLASTMQQALDEGRTLLREGLADLLDHAVDRLTDQTSGKRKIFRDSMVARWIEFLETFDARNLSGDDELAKVVSQLRDLTQYTPAQLRASAAARRSAREVAAAARSALDSLLEDAPTRRLSLD